MKKLLAVVMSLAMLVGATAISAGAAYSDSSSNVTYENGLTPNTDHGGGVTKGNLTQGDTVGTGKVDIMVQTGKESDTTNVYAVSFTPAELTFNYGSDTSYIWNPETQKYEIIGTGGSDGWTTTTSTITITNYSDLPIDVEAAFAKDGTVSEEVTVTFTDSDEVTKDDNKLSLLSAVTTGNLNEQGSPKSGTFTVALNGNLTNPYTAPTKLGTVTLTIKVPTT